MLNPAEAVHGSLLSQILVDVSDVNGVFPREYVGGCRSLYQAGDIQAATIFVGHGNTKEVYPIEVGERPLDIQAIALAKRKAAAPQPPALQA